MISFKNFIVESSSHILRGELGISKHLHDFLWHLTSPNPHGSDHEEGKDYYHGVVPLHEDIDNKEFLEFIFEGNVIGHPKLKSMGVPYAGTEGAYHPHNIVREGIKKEILSRQQHNKENEERVKAGEKPKPYPSIRQRISDGFHAALNNNEDAKERKRKAKESVEHFRQYMHEHGGHAKGNKLEFMGQNGKTASSSGDGRNTIGASLAPHTVGTSDPYGQVKCPGHHFDNCPNASSECKENCLGLTAGGNRQYPEAALRAKVIRQRYLMEHPEHAARVMSHEISENEKWTSNHHTIHDKDGSIVGYQNKKSGKVKSEVKHMTHDEVKQKLDNGELHKRNIESGVRLNVTSDLKWHKFGGGALMKKHPNTHFYDYTKNVSSTKDDLPSNYSLALSHTGDNHPESNSHHVVDHLRNGGVVAMVHHRGKNSPTPKRVKVIGSKEGEDEWHVANGDNDDNIDHRHDAAADHHNKIADEHEAAGNRVEAEKHRKIAQEYKTKKRGVVSGLELKGVTNDAAGNFANKVDKDGTIWIHDHPHKKYGQTLPMHK